MPSFKIIQGGMGVGVSGWPLARAVSRLGQLGVVSGTGISAVVARRLQSGDPGGHMRRALAAFPIPGVARRLLELYFVEGGKPAGAPFALLPMPQFERSAAADELTVAANFVEVFLAKEGHEGVVGINYLEKIQIPHLPSLYGAMLAGVDYVLMGAGIPRLIPGMLDAFAAGMSASYPLHIEDEAKDNENPAVMTFDPAVFWGGPAPQLTRPKFLAIISSSVLATTLARKANGRVDGFIIEGDSAGGHNAPPRGPLQLNHRGEPVYGPRDIADLQKIKALDIPFWLAGGYGRPGKLAEALSLGAAGIQVGTAFAFCSESGIEPGLKRRAIDASRAGTADVFTDPAASPTGFPLKLLRLAGTLSDDEVHEQRIRVCDLGYLRQAYRKSDGQIGYRCPAEPVDHYVRKGGRAEDTVGRKCLCNGLFANIGLPQSRPAGPELPLLTVGNDITLLEHFISPNQDSYTAENVIDRLLAGT
jgi:nitronate monooxygenase